MSCHHHHHSPPPPHNHHHANNNHHSSSSCSCCCCCSFSDNCFTSCCCKSAAHSTISSLPSDHHQQQQLLQALLLIQFQTQSPPPPSKPTIFLKPQKSSLPFNNPRGRRHHHRPLHEDEDDGGDDDSTLLLRSLIRRVSALESSLSSYAPPQKRPSSAAAAARQQQTHRRSLKDAAAAVIQRCFRRFLARRSKTLRDLKLLASIKSHAASLRSSLAGNQSFNRKKPRALSEKAMDLLFQLDSIQSSDPTIREGKRSISKELVRISEFINKILIREIEEKQVDESEKRRRRERARKVSFGEMDGDDECQVFDDLPDRISELEDEEEEAHLASDREEFPDNWSSDGRESPKVNGDFRGSNGSLGLAAPLPVKMEPRRSGCMKKVANEED